MPISSALGSSALLPAGLGFRNLIQNGNMVVDQRSIASSPITNTAAASTTALDRWNFYGSLAKMTMTQSTDVPSTEVFTKSLKITTAASTFTPGAGDYYGVRQVIEGQNFAAAGYGTSAAKPLVLSFWVKCSTTGTFSVSLFNREAPDRSYVSTYVINSANTWEKKIIYIQSGDTSGTWLTTSGIGLQLWWDLGSGSSQNATAGVWNSSLKVNTSSQPNFVGTNAGTFYLTGVQLEQNYQPTPFEQRPIGVELALCERYYQKCGVWHGAANNATNWLGTASARTSMRTTPSIGATGVLVVSNFYTADPQQSSLSISILSSGSDQLSICFWIFNLSGLTGGGYYGGGRSPGGVGTGNYLLLSAEL
jgi:hypothetical protein